MKPENYLRRAEYVALAMDAMTPDAGEEDVARAQVYAVLATIPICKASVRGMECTLFQGHLGGCRS